MVVSEVLNWIITLKYDMGINKRTERSLVNSTLQASRRPFKLIEARSKLHWPVSGLFLFAAEEGDGSMATDVTGDTRN